MRLFSLVTLISLCAGGASAQEGWRWWQSTDGGYRVEFIGPPEIENFDTEADGSPIRSELASYANCQSGFTRLKTFDGDKQHYLTLIMDRDMSTYLGALRQDDASEADGVASRRYMFDVKDGVGIARMVMRGTTVYQLQCVVAPGHENDPDVARFLNSLELL